MARYSAEIEKIALLLLQLRDRMYENDVKMDENEPKIGQKRPKKP